MNKITTAIYLGCLVASWFTPLMVSFILVCIALSISSTALIRLIAKNEILKHSTCGNAPTCPHKKEIK